MPPFIGYPRQRVLAVFDTPAAADAGARAAAEARARAGAVAVSADAAIERYAGAADADRFDATGQHHGVVARSLRAVQFSLMDQLPALAWYEAALRDGRAVVAVRTRNRAETVRVVEALRSAGGHFINRFGRLATEEFARWRGPEPRVPDLMKH